jgi:MFS family permease
MAAGEMIYAPTISTYITTRAGKNRRASYQAALSISEDIGTAIGPISGLALAAATSPVTVWAVGAFLCTLAGAATHRAATCRPRKRTSPDTPAAPPKPGSR